MGCTSRGVVLRGVGGSGSGLVGRLALKSWRSQEQRIPYVWQLVFSYVSVEWWVLDMDEHGFLDGSGMAGCILV